MATNSDEVLARFHRRIRRTAVADLRRNIEAGVYGAPGTEGRAVAERAHTERVAQQAETMWLARRQEAAALVERAVRAELMARRAGWLSALALLLALIAVAIGVGAPG